ncbi:fatty acid desaturase [Bacillus coahuilensis]|uniref:fatty acid desaturase n=1 Tax=Bacillus coahuilensis TaxID=408580 RepID=UPI0001850FC0|nr:fatty acid desaturase [Bacillus coahuilensis]
MLRKLVAPYEKSDHMKSTIQLLNTLLPFFLVWFLAYKSLEIHYIITLGFAIIGAGLLTRIFIIFHDCCHHSFYKNRKLNSVLGTITGVLTLFPFKKWQHEHSVHHASSGNLDKRGVGDIWMMTVEEYQQATPMTRLQYRLYRHPIVMLFIGPTYVFLFKNRMNRKKARKTERLNTYLTNALIAGIIVLLCYTIGWEAFLLVQAPIFLISGTMGVWLFYVQHTFEDSYFEWSEEWEYVKAAVEGSSYYKLPKVLQWFTGNIGYHHVHHLSPRVPNYKLEDAHMNAEPLQHVPTITLRTSLASIKFRLWDEKNKRYIGFKQLKQLKVIKEMPVQSN